MKNIELIDAKFNYVQYMKDIEQAVVKIKDATFTHWSTKNDLSSQSEEDVKKMIAGEFEKYNPSLNFADYLIFGPVRTYPDGDYFPSVEVAK